MHTYITLYNWTEQGIKNVKASPARMEAATKTIEGAGGKLLGLYVTLGEYDVVAISAWPSEEAATAFVLAQAALGFVRTKTLKAFTPAEFAAIVQKMQ